jgi:predicted ATPase/DNA-binding SARP family transcriptional activator
VPDAGRVLGGEEQTGAPVVDVDLLGPIGVRVDGRPVEVRSPKQRALLAALALAEGAVVSVDALVDALWGDEEPPADPRGSLQSYVSRLRSQLGDAITHGPAGYRLEQAGGRTDVRVVMGLVDQARASDQPALRAALLGDALERWRGEPLGELAGYPSFRPDAVRLAELRLVVTDEHHRALLDAGQVDAALPGLEHAAAGAPLREATQLLLVRALALAGRVAEALRAADRYRHDLVEGTGLDPGPELGRLERQILAGDLSATAPPVLDEAQAPGAVAPSARPAPSLPRIGRFVGRRDELADLRRYLDEQRVVSVVGTGGVGKTRLVAEVVAQLSLEVLVVELAAAHPGEVAATIATAAGLAAPGPAVEDVVITFLATDDRLLVLDGAEHVAAEVRSLLARVLAVTTRARVVVTTRVRLGLGGEQVLPLDPLPVPEDDSDRAPDEVAASVELFVDRVRRADPRAGQRLDGDPLVADICRRLDGLPLALELAAGRVATLGLSGLHQRLDTALDLLSTPSGQGPDQVTLRDVVAWSDRLLDPVSAEAARALATFEAGFSLAAAEAVLGELVEDPGLALVRLVESSMLLVDHDGGGARYRMLDTVRQHLAEQAAGTPVAAVAARAHSDTYAALLTRTAAAIPGPGEAAALDEARSQRANVRSGMARLLDLDDPASVAAASEAAARVVLYHPELGLGAWLAAAPRAPASAVAGPTDLASILAGASRSAWQAGATADAIGLAAAALDRPARPEARAIAWHSLGVAGLYDGRHDEAIGWWARVVDDDEAAAADRADALAGIALARAYGGRHDEAVSASADMASVVRPLRSDTYLAMHAYVAGEVAQAAGDDRAVALLERSVRLAGQSRARLVGALASTALASTLVRSGELDDARPRLVELLELLRRGATWPQLWTAVRLVAEAVGHDRPDAARALLDAADQAPEAPAVIGSDAVRLAGLRERLATQGPSGAHGVPGTREEALLLAMDALAGPGIAPAAPDAATTA